MNSPPTAAAPSAAPISRKNANEAVAVPTSAGKAFCATIVRVCMPNPMPAPNRYASALTSQGEVEIRSDQSTAERGGHDDGPGHRHPGVPAGAAHDVAGSEAGRPDAEDHRHHVQARPSVGVSRSTICR